MLKVNNANLVDLALKGYNWDSIQHHKANI